MSKHTPGPWDAVGLTVYDTCMDGVASCHSADDARLIAAAPELLQALYHITNVIETYVDFDPDSRLGEAVAVANAAIAKSEGK